jgi:hypothetical protein
MADAVVEAALAVRLSCPTSADFPPLSPNVRRITSVQDSAAVPSSDWVKAAFPELATKIDILSSRRFFSDLAKLQAKTTCCLHSRLDQDPGPDPHAQFPGPEALLADSRPKHNAPVPQSAGPNSPIPLVVVSEPYFRDLEGFLPWCHGLRFWKQLETIRCEKRAKGTFVGLGSLDDSFQYCFASEVVIMQ